ncbi:MAG TPA: hypothetical protein VEF76_00650 [Patescibacteria group bacterium]|nr:hypothetical protein [Patescibacteria group bacterium]
MKKSLIIFAALGFVFLLTGPAAAVFECPWTPASGNNPSADGNYGGDSTTGGP